MTVPKGDLLFAVPVRIRMTVRKGGLRCTKVQYIPAYIEYNDDT